MARMAKSLTPYSFGDLISKWLAEQPELSHFKLCCTDDNQVHFVVGDNYDQHVAAISRNGYFWRKINARDDIWDNGSSMHIADKDFFLKLTKLLLER